MHYSNDEDILNMVSKTKYFAHTAAIFALTVCVMTHYWKVAILYFLFWYFSIWKLSEIRDSIMEFHGQNKK